MLRLTFLTLIGIGLVLMVGGRDLSPEELAEIETKRASKAPFSVASLIETKDLKPAAQAEPLPQVTKAANNDSILTLASFDTQPEAQIIAEPEKVAAVTDVEEEVSEFPIYYVTAKRVNVRQGPSTDYSIVNQVHNEDAVTVLSDPELPWVQIQVADGTEGYMAAKFLTANKSF